MFDASVYRARRSALVEALRARGMDRGKVVFSSHGESPINYQDNAYPFRQDSNWLYYIGLNEPDMVAVIDLFDGTTSLFGNELSIDALVWTGPRPHLRDLAERSGIEKTAGFSSASVGAHAVFVPTCRLETARRVGKLLGVPEERLLGPAEPALISAIVSQREIKDDLEIAELEKAVGVTVRMHSELIRSLQPGWTEARAASFITGIALDAGCSLSFSPIATVRGAYLHYHSRQAVCENGDMFLLDAGAETQEGYAGDLTSVFPVAREFSEPQASLYTLLEEVFLTATKLLRPGILFRDVHRAASVRLAKGLVDFGLCLGNPEDIVDSGAHALFFPHGLGHLIGLDVHDMEGLGEDAVGYSGLERSTQFGLRSLRLAKALKPGMVHSVEPGIYFIPGLIERWKAEGRHKDFIRYDRLESWKELGGMRLEEDWLVTDSGGRRLGPEFDRSRDSIERARSMP